MIRNINGIKINPPVQTDINSETTENITGTTTEKVLSAVLIPAGTFVTGDVIGIETRLRTSGTNGSKTIRIRIGTTVNTSAELAAETVSLTNSHTFIPLSRMMAIKNGDDTELITNTQNPTSDIGVSYDSFIDYTLLTTDWTVANYIIVTGQLSHEEDTMNCMHIHTIFPGT